MTEEEKLDVILTELGRLLSALGDLSQHVVLIGGQVPALLSRQATGFGQVRVRTQTGVEIVRPYSFEPDLLFDAESAGFLADRLPDVLRSRGFERSERSHRWRKRVGQVAVEIDLFSSGEAEAPTVMTRLPSAHLVLGRVTATRFRTSTGEFSLLLPKPAAFIRTKLDARHLRGSDRDSRKDAFDIYAYVWLDGVEAVDQDIDAFSEGRGLRHELARLYGSAKAPGVQDVVAFAGWLTAEDAQLLAQAVADLFEPLMPR